MVEIRGMRRASIRVEITLVKDSFRIVVKVYAQTFETMMEIRKDDKKIIKRERKN